MLYYHRGLILMLESTSNIQRPYKMVVATKQSNASPTTCIWMCSCVCQSGYIVEFKCHVLLTELPVFTLFLWSLSFSLSFLSGLLFRSPHSSLGLYIVFSWPVKPASVKHSLSLFMIFIFHSTSGCAIFILVNLSQLPAQQIQSIAVVFLAPKASIRDTLAYDLCWNTLCTNHQNLCKGNFLL